MCRSLHFQNGTSCTKKQTDVVKEMHEKNSISNRPAAQSSRSAQELSDFWE